MTNNGKTYKIDTQKPVNTKDTADFSFVFSDNVADWQRKRTMSQEARFLAKKKRQPKPDTMGNTGWSEKKTQSQLRGLSKPNIV